MEHIYIDIDNLVLVENKYILYMVYTDVLTYIQKMKLYVIYIYTLYIHIYKYIYQLSQRKSNQCLNL